MPRSTLRLRLACPVAPVSTVQPVTVSSHTVDVLMSTNVLPTMVVATNLLLSAVTCYRPRNSRVLPAQPRTGPVVPIRVPMSMNARPPTTTAVRVPALQISLFVPINPVDPIPVHVNPVIRATVKMLERAVQISMNVL